MRYIFSALILTTLVNACVQIDTTPCASTDVTQQSADASQDIAKADVFPAKPKMACVGNLLHVPAQCATIQEAVNTAGKQHLIVLVAAGTYAESVTIPQGADVVIARDGLDEVVIDGGSKSAISSSMAEMLSLQGLTLMSQQAWIDYASATVFVALTSYLEIRDCTIKTSSMGLSISYIGDMEIYKSAFIGEGSSSLGIAWDFADPGSRVYKSSFKNLKTAISWCVGEKPELSPFAGQFPNEDSNTYDGVETKLFENKTCLGGW